jgi:phytoene dehydrogenase-like protein
MKYDAIVIGAGSNGLTAAAVLAKKGRKVLVLESATEIGGMRRAIEIAPGFRTPLHGDPGWAPPSVVQALGLRPPTITPPGLTGSPSGLRPGYELLMRLHRFAGVLEALYQLTPPDIDTTSPTEIVPLLRVAMKTRALGREDMIEFMRVMPMSIQDLLDDAKVDDAVMHAAIAAAAVRDLRQGPRSAGTTFNLLHSMVGGSPGTFSRSARGVDGPISFTASAERVAREKGVEIRLGTRVERILVADDAVTGVVVVGGEEIQAPVVISTADPKRTMFGLVDPVWLDPEFMLAVKNLKMRGCAAFVLYAIGGRDLPKFSTDGIQSLTLSSVAIEKAADAAKYGEISENPHVEIFSASTYWKGMAPDGKAVVAARVQYAPYALKSGAWDRAAADALGAKVTAAISRAYPGFDGRVEHRVVLTPRDLEEKFGVTEGALTHGEMTLDQILFMRPVPGWGHYEMPIRGLFLGGAGAHPGPGVLGGAGLLAARAALRAR